jgi:hypothetical protein
MRYEVKREALMRNRLCGSTALATACAWLLVGCAATTAGMAVKAPLPVSSDGATVALLDTGSYPVKPNHPFGPAGSMDKGAAYEGRRMAEYVLGPWQANASLRYLIPMPTTVVNDEVLDTDQVLDRPLADLAKAHHFLAGFASARRSGRTFNEPELTNVVLRFTDPAAADAAAGEMAAVAAGLGNSPGKPLAVFAHPEAVAWTDTLVDGWVEVRSFVAHGPYLLYQRTAAPPDSSDPTVQQWGQTMISAVLNLQPAKIDGFIPTDPAKFTDLPTDPTGQLRALTLWAADGRAPRSVGVWQPTAALHFEDDPIQSDSLFQAAGVEEVSQMLAKVYETHQPDGAQRLVKQFAADTATLPDVQPTSGVPGLPGAECFERTANWSSSTDAPTMRQSRWHFKCVAKADRYAFVTYSDTAIDVRQQTSAQYRILAGK